MSHVLLSHGAEKISTAQFLDIILIFVIAAIWFYMPSDGLAIISQWFYNKVVKLMLDLPYSRELETEADTVGLQLMAKACYDVRESSTFWRKMQVYSKMKKEEEIPEFISTHPSNESRSDQLDKIIPKAMELREACNCPSLKGCDPRVEMKQLLLMIDQQAKEEEKQAKEEQAREANEEQQRILSEMKEQRMKEQKMLQRKTVGGLQNAGTGATHSTALKANDGNIGISVISDETHVMDDINLLSSAEVKAPSDTAVSVDAIASTDPMHTAADLTAEDKTVITMNSRTTPLEDSSAKQTHSDITTVIHKESNLQASS